MIFGLKAYFRVSTDRRTNSLMHYYTEHPRYSNSKDAEKYVRFNRKYHTNAFFLLFLFYFYYDGVVPLAPPSSNAGRLGKLIREYAHAHNMRPRDRWLERSVSRAHDVLVASKRRHRVCWNIQKGGLSDLMHSRQTDEPF